MERYSVRALWIALMIIFAGAPAWAENAYVTNGGDGTVSVISTASDTVTATIAVGTAPYGVAVTPDGSKVYVTDGHDNTVSVIMTASNTVTATIPVGASPNGVTVTPDGSTVYVAISPSLTGESSVSAIETASDTVTATIPVGNLSYALAVTPDGSKVYVASYDNGTVSVIATASNTVTETISVGNEPTCVAVSPDGSKVYVASFARSPSTSGAVSVIATATNTVTATVPLYSYPTGIAVAPDGSKVYVAGFDSAVVSVISTASNTVTATIPLGDTGGEPNMPAGLALTADGSNLYVATSYATYPSFGSVSVISTASNTVTGTISVGLAPGAFGQFIGPAPAAPPAASLVSAILPGSRSVDVTSPASVFATMLNATPNPLSNCYVTLPDSFAPLVGEPSLFSLSYQTTSSATNAPIGEANTPAVIPANGAQSFVLSFTSLRTTTMPAIAPVYRCDGVAEAATFTGVNTVDLLFSSTPIPDVIALAASTTPGVVTIPFSKQGAAAFAVASDNVGVDGTMTVQTDTGGATLPLTITLCQTNPQGACLAPPSANVSLDFAAGSTPTFSFFVTASGNIPFSPGSSRIFVRFLDSGGASHGSTSLAVDTD